MVFRAVLIDVCAKRVWAWQVDATGFERCFSDAEFTGQIILYILLVLIVSLYDEKSRANYFYENSVKLNDRTEAFVT